MDYTSRIIIYKSYIDKGLNRNGLLNIRKKLYAMPNDALDTQQKIDKWALLRCVRELISECE